MTIKLALAAAITVLALPIAACSSSSNERPATTKKAAPAETEREKVLKKPMSKEAREAVEAEPAEAKKAKEAGQTAYWECYKAEESKCDAKREEAEAASHSEGK